MLHGSVPQRISDPGRNGSATDASVKPGLIQDIKSVPSEEG
jgi:hypothetical protein